MKRIVSLAAMCVLALGAAACDRKTPEPQPSESAAPSPPPNFLPPPVETPSATPSVQPSETTAALDLGALGDRRDPDRLLQFYADAIHRRDWANAARAWGKGSGVTAKTLEASYNRSTPPTLEVGKGSGDAGAGSQFYEAPVTLRFGDGARPERGSLFLRRVNDVDGATAEQTRWHIERSTIGAGQ